MQKKSLIDCDEIDEKQKIVKRGHLRRKSSGLFGTPVEIRTDLDYFLKKPKLNLIDKRLLLGVF